MIALNKIDKNIPITLKYERGNIFAYVHEKDFDSKVLLTNETYFFIKDEVEEIWNIIIGKPSNCNLLYNRPEYDGITSTIDKLANIAGLNSIPVIP